MLIEVRDLAKIKVVWKDFWTLKISGAGRCLSGEVRGGPSFLDQHHFPL
jgi:hypothetical protein